MNPETKLQNLRNGIENECGILVPNELIFTPFYGGTSFTFTHHFPSVVKVKWWRWQGIFDILSFSARRGLTPLLYRVIVMEGLVTRFQYMQLFGWDLFLNNQWLLIISALLAPIIALVRHAKSVTISTGALLDQKNYHKKRVNPTAFNIQQTELNADW